jgi:UDP-2-acetamido-3-amino-2,3-dideoxy-glucuronate N-acetyltransferase
VAEYQVHDTSRVDPGAEIGAGTRIWHFSHVMAGARIGRDCMLAQNVFVAGGVVIGHGVKIQNNVSIYEGVTLEDGVFCGPSTVFTNVVTPRSHVSRRHAYARTVVRQGATLGANSTLLCGIEIGRYAFIGAGAVVTRDVPAYALVVGNPARHVGWACACGERLGPRRGQDGGHGARTLTCAACAAVYRADADGNTLTATG